MNNITREIFNYPPEIPAIYIFWKDLVTPLYIGRTNNLASRIHQHYTESRWYNDYLQWEYIIKNTRMITYADFSEMEDQIADMEKYLIQKYNPSGNKKCRTDKKISCNTFQKNEYSLAWNQLSYDVNRALKFYEKKAEEHREEREAFENKINQWHQQVPYLDKNSLRINVRKFFQDNRYKDWEEVKLKRLYTPEELMEVREQYFMEGKYRNTTSLIRMLSYVKDIPYSNLFMIGVKNNSYEKTYAMEIYPLPEMQKEDPKFRYGDWKLRGIA